MKQTLANKIIVTEQNNLQDIFLQKGKIYSFLNPVSYLIALKKRDLFENLDGIFADGNLLVNAILLAYFHKVTRRSFDMVGIAPALFEHIEETEKSIYFIGAEQSEIEKAVNIFHAHYPKMKIAGFRNGFFENEAEKDAEIKKVVDLNPDYLIVSMGICKQEDMLIRAKNAGYQGVGFTCGGFIRQTSMNKINYYPTWANQLNLRFIYRFFKEKHTRSRYFISAVKFPLRFLSERIRGR